jgi:hypothetical protein
MEIGAERQAGAVDFSDRIEDQKCSDLHEYVADMYGTFVRATIPAAP